MKIKHIVEPKPIWWSDLDDGLIIDDKLSIFEQYYITGSLTESNEASSKNYFESLFSMSDTPEVNQKYIVVPLVLINNNITQLDTPSYMKFLGQARAGGLAFAYADGTQKTYPSTTMRELSLTYTFTFLSSDTYDKFRTSLAMKFNKQLPNFIS